MKLKFLAICAFSILTLAACGGGGGDSSSGSSADTTATGATTGTRVAGTVVASDTGQPLAGVQVQLAGKTSTTAADGSFSQDGLEATDGVVVRFVRDGYADAFATTDVISGASSKVTARMAPVAASTTFDNAAGATLSDSASPARVALAPSSLVNAATGAAPQGTVTATIAPINPATNPANMPGNYTSSSGDPIESFGALSVQLRDSAGNRLNLAAGSKATIRIPLASRSTAPPQTIPLYYFNETTGRWVEEGSATLAGVAPDQYYEGSVGHFSTWNADRLFTTVFVNGCLVDASGGSLSGTEIGAEGIDYSGSAFTKSDSQGKFKIGIRPNSRVKIEGVFPRTTSAIVAGPSATDITLPTCLTVDSAAASKVPVFFVQPESKRVPPGTPVSFFALMRGGGDLTFQWFRNGQAIEGATQAVYTLRAAGAEGEQTQFTVRVSNAAGSVTSDPATLTVSDDLGPQDFLKLYGLIFRFQRLTDMTQAPIAKFTTNTDVWSDPSKVCLSGTVVGDLNGQPLPVGAALASGAMTLNGTFDNCQAGVSEAITGLAKVSYTYDATTKSGNGSSEAVNFRSTRDVNTGNETDFTGNGTVQGTISKTIVGTQKTVIETMTVVPGATLRDNLTGQITQFRSGSSVLTTLSYSDLSNLSVSQPTEQRDINFAIDGTPYRVNGAMNAVLKPGAGFTFSGELTLTRNGTLIGRMFGGADGSMYYEIKGVATRQDLLGSLVAGSAAVPQAK